MVTTDDVDERKKKKNEVFGVMVTLRPMLEGLSCYGTERVVSWPIAFSSHHSMPQSSGLWRMFLKDTENK